MSSETFDITTEDAVTLGTRLSEAFNPRSARAEVPVDTPEPVVWQLDGGTAWVWRVPGNDRLTRPVVIADGFSGGASKLEEWLPLWRESGAEGVHHWGTQLHEAGRDVVVLGYASRSASIRTNAEVAVECIQRVAAEREGEEPLVVGGLSMGGLVTRYALASMESRGIEHEVGTYFSYDSPHRGAWIPLSLQSFAHFLSGLADLIADPEKKQQLKSLQQLINSDAARELLWKHTATHIGAGPDFAADAKHTALFAQLAELGSFPTGPRLLGVANGRGDGQGLEVTAGADNLVWPRDGLGPGATLKVQNQGDAQTAATLQRIGLQSLTVRTSGIPALDGAPGGTLDSFHIAAEALRDAGFAATAAFPDVCFVPVASAVDLADPSDPYAPVDDVDPRTSGLDAFKVATHNEQHTLLTSELCTWLTEQFDAGADVGARTRREPQRR
jgi:hypothetical protein